MKLLTINVQNYKSIKNVNFSPASFALIVGRNGSGKSNFCDALDFASLVYAEGLEHAVARKGGYENIAYRRERRSRSPISFEVKMEGLFDEASEGVYFIPLNRMEKYRWTFMHSFSFKATGEGIRSDFVVIHEHLEIIAQDPEGGAYSWIRLERDETGIIKSKGDFSSIAARGIFFDSEFIRREVLEKFELDRTELILDSVFFRQGVVRSFKSWMQNMGVFQVSPEISRNPGVPTPNPNLSAKGDNLPAVVDWIQRKHPDSWDEILSSMKEIVPEISEITVSYLHTRTLGLFFNEVGLTRSWAAEEVSDGTIRSLALLVACHDPRATGLIVEEPENSLHPWITTRLIKGLRKISSYKSVFMTTHSPIVLNMVRPEEVWVCYKEGGETMMSALTTFDDSLVKDWEAGSYRLFDYLDAGFVSQAVPN